MLPTQGYAAPAAKVPLGPYSFERREPGAHDVLIDIQYCGICHTDIHQVRDEWGPGIYPMVPGHEIAGVVAAVGGAVTKFKIGDKVGVGCFVESCRSCASCQEGLEQYCASGGLVFTYNSREKDGTPTMGGYSDKIVVDENYVLRMPENLPLDACAPLLCAGITLFSPLRHWNAGPGKKVAIIGLGGLGHVGVKLAHAMGAEVTVLSQSLKKQEDGKKLGADHFLATSDPATFETCKGTFDLIISTVSADLEWAKHVDLLRPSGSLVVVGIPVQPMAVPAFPLVMGRRSVAGSMIGGIAETQEMLDYCAEKGITCDVEVIPMNAVNEAYERILKSDVRYRFVIDMATLNPA